MAFLDQDSRFLWQAGEGKGGRLNSFPQVKHKQIHQILLCGNFLLLLTCRVMIFGPDSGQS